MRRTCVSGMVVGLGLALQAGVALGGAEAVADRVELAGPPVDFVQIEGVTGQAQYFAIESGAWRSITQGDSLPVGVMVRTGLRSEVVGVMADGSKLYVGSIARGELDAGITAQPGFRSSLVINSGDIDERLLRLNTRHMGVVVPQPTLGVQPMLVPPGRGDRDSRFGLPMRGKPEGSPRR